MRISLYSTENHWKDSNHCSLETATADTWLTEIRIWNAQSQNVRQGRHKDPQRQGLDNKPS